MEEMYNLQEENQENEITEPAVSYDYQAETEMKFSPPLTEEELEDSITGDELLEYIFQKIDKLPGK